MGLLQRFVDLMASFPVKLRFLHIANLHINYEVKGVHSTARNIMNNEFNPTG